jgi:hypothetical protein
MHTSSSASPEPTITTGKHSIPRHGHIARYPLILSTVEAKGRRAIDALGTSPVPSIAAEGCTAVDLRPAPVCQLNPSMRGPKVDAA